MDPISIAMAGIIIGCSHHAFGNSCDEDAECWSWLKMYECHEQYFGDIHTPAYMAALRNGKNINARQAQPIREVGRDVHFAIHFR